MEVTPPLDLTVLSYISKLETMSTYKCRYVLLKSVFLYDDSLAVVTAISLKSKRNHNLIYKSPFHYSSFIYIVPSTTVNKVVSTVMWYWCLCNVFFLGMNMMQMIDTFTKTLTAPAFSCTIQSPKYLHFRSLLQNLHFKVKEILYF